MLNIFAFKWGNKFNADYVHKLAAGLRRHLAAPHTFECITDNATGFGSHIRAWRLRDPALCKGCFVRMRLYDRDYQVELGIDPGDRIVIIDLDVVLTGPLDPVFDRPEPFLILTGVNRSGTPYNGGLQMFDAGYRPDVWSDMPANVASMFHNDEDWLAHKIPGVVGWPAGQDGVYGFMKPGWSHESGNIDGMPADARAVFFIGWRKPSAFRELPWVKRHWQC